MGKKPRQDCPYNADCPPRTTPNVESGPCHAPLVKKAIARPDRPVDLLINDRRKRLIDPDGACAKYVIDGLVDRGILEDDTAKEIGLVAHVQEKIPKGESEETVILIYEKGRRYRHGEQDREA